MRKHAQSQYIVPPRSDDALYIILYERKSMGQHIMHALP